MTPQKPNGQQTGGGVRPDTLGYTFAFTVLMFAGAGYLLDRWLGWIPVLTIVGTLAGAAVAFAWVYGKVRQDEADAHGGDPKRNGHGE
jgi:F0F1-type ATP synthase assembly protein I